MAEVHEPNSPTASVTACPASDPTPAPIAVTTYTYDVLDNLLTVTQSGSRQRTFTYNSLWQLTSATNAESGTICYGTYSAGQCQGNGYDANGNLLTKVAPAPNQTNPAVTVTTTYAYDALHRLTQKSYSDTTPAVKFGYDAVAPAGCTPPALIIANGVGRRTSMCDAAGAAAWSYDITAGVGWKNTERRTTNGITKTTVYQNNLDGSLGSLTYASGRTVTYAPGGAGRPLAAKDTTTTNTINYGLSASYAPQGALSSLVLGQTASFTGINLNQAYNNRLQPATIRAWSTNGVALDLAYCFNKNIDLSTNNCGATPIVNNGNVAQIKNNQINDRTENFTYDELNRIATAKTSATTGANCWGETFSYDIWGNLLSIGAVTGYTGCTQENLSVSVTAQNQISGFTYDAAGNLTTVPPPGGASYTYDAENRMTSAAGVTYTYDGDGKRVQKSTGRLYWYGMGGDPLAESDAAGTITDEYIFFGGKRIARRKLAAGDVNYYFGDHLGTARVITDATGNVLDDSDFYPFGGERPVVSSSGNNYKFTGKERDSESGLDNFGARYYSSSQGRFTSVDPSRKSIKPADPQSWNRYNYTLNNPLRYIDHNGKWPTDIHNRIIDRAFPGLSQQQRDALRATSRWVDRPAGQTRAHNHEHAMRSPGEDPAAARRAIDANIQNQQRAAQQAQGGTPANTSEIRPAALNEFGQVLHTVMDRTSPAHTDQNGNPREWSGIPVTPGQIAAAGQHAAEEANITPEQMNTAANAAREAFRQTFGEAAHDQAIREPEPEKPKKKEKEAQ